MSPIERRIETARIYSLAGYGLLRGVVGEFGVRPVVEAVRQRQHHAHVPIEASVVSLELPPSTENLRHAA
ncbi:MAG: hypothetical protein AAB971_00960 [Patescibacteria group bacterium]|mgnify:CR=1